MISRGNYRKELFLNAGTGEAFEQCLFDAVDRCGWKLHAYVIISNHYHLAIETPDPNLGRPSRVTNLIRKSMTND